MEAQRLLKKFRALEEKYGNDAIIAMYHWTLLADNQDDEDCQALSKCLERILAIRAIDIFDAALNGENVAEVYARANARARELIERAAILTDIGDPEV